MKTFLIAISLFCLSSPTSFAQEYPVSNFDYIDNPMMGDLLSYEDNSLQVVVISETNCLQFTPVERGCMLFEKKLDAYLPSFSNKKIQVVGVDRSRAYMLQSQTDLTAHTTVLFIQEGRILHQLVGNPPPHEYQRVAQLDPARPQDFMWREQLLAQVLDVMADFP